MLSVVPQCASPLFPKDDQWSVPSRSTKMHGGLFKRERTISPSSSEDSYDELEMYESLPDYEGESVLYKHNSSRSPIDNKDIEDDKPRIEIAVKRRKFRKVRCSKLIKRTEQNSINCNSEHSFEQECETVVHGAPQAAGMKQFEEAVCPKSENTRLDNTVTVDGIPQKTCKFQTHFDLKGPESHKTNKITLDERKNGSPVSSPVKVQITETNRSVSSGKGHFGNQKKGIPKINVNPNLLHPDFTGSELQHKAAEVIQSCKENNENHVETKMEESIEGFLEFSNNTGNTKQKDTDVYQCSQCFKTFRTKYTFTVHLRTHRSEKPHTCDECGVSLKSKRNLQIHKLNKHSSVRQYVCAVCDKSFKSASYMKTHMNIHLKTRFYCDLCGCDFSALQTLKEHIQFRHLEMHLSKEIPTKPVELDRKCSVCDKTFSHALNLKLHMQTHDGTQEYECDLCGALFSRKTDRNRHRMRHTGEKPLKCNVCDYSCIQPGDLNRHKLKHGETQGRHQCPYCQKSLVRKCEMKAHIASHFTNEVKDTGIKCKLCDQYFTTKHSLNKHHVEVHQKNFVCNVCGQNFASVGNRNRHKQRQHSNLEFACNVCKKTFNCKANLQEHFKCMH